MRAQPARAFTESIGVNIRLGGGTYSEPGRVLASLRRLGIQHVRTTMPTTADSEELFRTFALSGVRFNVVATLGDGDTPDVAASVADRLVPFAQSLDSIQGPNEWDAYRRGVDDWPQRIAAYQRHLYEAVNARPELRDIPVLPATFADYGNIRRVPSMRGSFDQAAMHTYAFGNPSEFALDYFLRVARASFGRSRIQSTEAGYHTSTIGPFFQPGVNAASRDAYVPRLYADNFRRGIVRTHLWQLLDTPAPPGFPDQEAHFGLLTQSHAEKPAARSIRHLLTILRDRAQPFTPRPLPLFLSGPSDVRSVLLQKSNGVHYLLLWRATSSWNPQILRPVAVPRRAAYLRLAQRGSVHVVDPSAFRQRWTAPARTRSGAMAVSLQNKLIVVRIVARR